VSRLFICLAILAIIGVDGGKCDAAGAAVHYSNAELGLSFDYPEVWGPVLLTDYRERHSRMVYGMDWELRFENPPIPCRARLLVREVMEDLPLRIVVYEGSRDTTNLTELRREIESQPNCKVDGCPARVEEIYYEPAGEAWRVTSWFNKTQFFELTEAARTYEFANRPHDEGVALGLSRLIALNPDDSRLVEFNRDIAQFLADFRTAQ